MLGCEEAAHLVREDILIHHRDKPGHLEDTPEGLLEGDKLEPPWVVLLDIQVVADTLEVGPEEDIPCVVVEHSLDIPCVVAGHSLEVGYKTEHGMYNKQRDVSKLCDHHNRTSRHPHHEAFPTDGFYVLRLRNNCDTRLECRLSLHT